MSKEKVTIQDIADALGLSRTTVSKALNGSSGMPEKTVCAVLQKAKEMNYKQFAYLADVPDPDANPSEKGGNLALLAHIMPNRFHIASTLMATLEQEISKHGYSLTIHILSNEDILSLSLPQNLKLGQVDALICLELFDESYTRMLCGLQKPVLFSDAYCGFPHHSLHADLLLMENKYSVYHMLRTIMNTTKISSVGFIGDPNHCLSFHERYESYQAALMDSGIPFNLQNCIIDDDSFYGDDRWLSNRLAGLAKLPDMFFCANDLLAMQTISCLSKMGLSVPDDVLLCGFDDTFSLSSMNSTLTTVRTPSADMGIIASRLLLNRIADPDLPPTFTYLRTEVQFRQSTKLPVKV